ncbi:MAG: L,D-transpeptidase family protein [Acidiferrobacterales bacterium]|nr:L,D-transpeptidase family protein [Acidiferrobacterales bacterium]
MSCTSAKFSKRIGKLSLILPLVTLSLAKIAFAESKYEATIAESLSSLQSANLDHSLESLEKLVEKHPNSKLGHLLLADILSARAGSLDLVNQFASDPGQLDGLRDETRHRWRSQTAQTPAEQGMVPANLLASSPTQRYILAADASESRLYVYENLGTSYQLVADYFMTIGKQGMGKNKEGDLRTPEGVYFVTSYLPGEGLPDRYGPGAFPINYPNEYDKKLKRTGYGIWIHGTESENYNRVPLASDGCLSLSNDEFLEIQQFVSTDWTTPVIISSKFDWVQPETLKAAVSPARQLIDQWKADWESLDTDRFVSHYSPTHFKNYNAFVKRKKQVNAAKEFIEIDLNNLSIYDYPGDESMLIVSFDQEYRSDNHHSVTQKKQYWMKEAGRWQIIHES